MGRFIFSNYHYTHIVSIFYDYSRYSTRKSLINSLILKKDSLVVLLLKVTKSAIDFLPAKECRKKCR